MMSYNYTKSCLNAHCPYFIFNVTFCDIYYTDKKEYQIFLIYQEIQNGAAAKSYMTNGLLIYGEIFAHFLIYEEALPNM